MITVIKRVVEIHFYIAHSGKISEDMLRVYLHINFNIDARLEDKIVVDNKINNLIFLDVSLEVYNIHDVIVPQGVKVSDQHC